MSLVVSDFALVPALNISNKKPPSRLLPTDSTGCISPVSAYLLNNFNIDVDVLKPWVNGFDTQETDPLLAAPVVYDRCAKKMKQMLPSSSQMKGVSFQSSTSVYRIIGGNEHEISAWFYPLDANSNAQDWGITVQQGGDTYDAYVMIVFRLS